MISQAVCPSCSAGNRIGDRDGRTAKCGRCGAKLFTNAPLDVDDAQLGAHLKMTIGPVLIDIWAPWCGPCRAMAPHFSEAARRLEPDVRFLKLNADSAHAPSRMGIRTIPTLALFQAGREVARHAGVMTADQIADWIARALKISDPMEKRL